MKIRTSETEIRHLLIAWFAIALAFTIVLYRWNYDLNLPSIFAISAVTVGLAFIFHELAHKVVAQRYGAWAEFRMTPFMLLVAVLTAFAGFIFAAPGAVMISKQYLTRAESGKIAVAGPMMNVILAFLFFALLSLVDHEMVELIGRFGMLINAWLAVFNMIPVSVLDGRKVLAWDKWVYVVALALAIAVLVVNIVQYT